MLFIGFWLVLMPARFLAKRLYCLIKKVDVKTIEDTQLWVLTAFLALPVYLLDMWVLQFFGLAKFIDPNWR